MSAPALWRNRSFVSLFGAQVISLVGSGATTVALALFAYRMAGARDATIVLGNALMLRILAFLIVSQPAGVLADRVDRRAILVGSDIVRALLVGLLPFATSVPQVYALIFAINAVTALFTPTFEACIPSVVGDMHLVKALALSRLAADIEVIAAPAVAALIVTFFGAQWVFTFDAGTYVVSAVLVLFASIPRLVAPSMEPRRTGIVAQITFGTRAILREPSLRQAIIVSFAEAVAGACAIVGTVAYVRTTLGRGDSSVALAMAAVGVGSSISAIVLGRSAGRYEGRATDRASFHGRRHSWSRRALLLGGTILALTLAPGILVPPFAALLAMWFLIGAGEALVAIPSSALLADHTAEHERGRVYAAHFALTHAFWLVAYPAVGHSVERWGAPHTFSLAAVACGLVTIVAMLTGPPSKPHVHERHTDDSEITQR
jgi:NRE family putative nickel resistance protein-like MFS transporter